MEYLPPELVSAILSFLDPTTIVVCRQVCQKWRILSESLTHVMYLPKVISIVLRNLRCKELKKSRLVCKQWKHGVDQLTFNEVITLNARTDLHERDTEALLSQWNPFPSRIVKIEICRCHSNLDDNLAFFERFGEHILHLQVALHHSHTTVQRFKQITKYLKNLRGLVLSEKRLPIGSTEEDEGQVDSTPLNYDVAAMENLKFFKLDDSDCQLTYLELYQEVIKRSPNLEHLETNGYYPLDIGILRAISGPQPRLSLNTLRVDAEDPNAEAILEILSTAEITLKSLSLKINGFGNEKTCVKCTELLHNCLSKHGHTLERLELKVAWYGKKEGEPEFVPKILISFPSSKHLTNLRKLKLGGFSGKLDFLRDLSNLKYLMIIYCDSVDQDDPNAKQVLHELVPSLHEIYIPSYRTWASESLAFKNKCSNFMKDSSYIAKYCGLYAEGFP